MTKKTAEPPIKIVPGDGEEPMPVEIIERSIVEIAEAMKRIENTRLSRKALVILIHYNSKVPQRDIELVLQNLEYMDRIWLKQKR